MTSKKTDQAFKEFAIARGEAMDRGNADESNRMHEKLLEVLGVIRMQPDSGKEMLSKLISDPNKHVRYSAAAYLLPLDERVAKSVLTKLTKEPPFVGFNSSMVLQEWEKGNLELP
jgi:hypothetical protein